MSLKAMLSDELKRLAGAAGPRTETVRLAGPDQVGIEIDLTAVDSLGCACREIRLRVPALSGAGVDVLKEWADRLCRRVTYLLEGIGPLEADSDAGHVLVRSTPPDARADGTKYYEILLQSQAGGNFSLRRYRSEKGQPGREQVDLHTTHELLLKLVDDLVDTIP